MATPDVSADVESICGRCKEPTWHVVVAKVGDIVAKVECKQCGAQHKYRPPGGAPKSSAARKRTASKGASGTRSRSRRKAAASPPPQPVVVDPSLPIRPYSPREAFEAGAQINHVKFGVGVVRDLPSPGKMTVWFPGGDRVLVCAKPASLGLEPPNRRFIDED